MTRDAWFAPLRVLSCPEIFWSWWRIIIAKSGNTASIKFVCRSRLWFGCGFSLFVWIGVFDKNSLHFQDQMVFLVRKISFVYQLLQHVANWSLTSLQQSFLVRLLLDIQGFFTSNTSLAYCLILQVGGFSEPMRTVTSKSSTLVTCPLKFLFFKVIFEGLVFPAWCWFDASCFVDFQKSPSSHLIWHRTKDFSYFIGTSFSDPKPGRCTYTNQSSSLGPLGLKLSHTSN